MRKTVRYFCFLAVFFLALNFFEAREGIAKVMKTEVWVQNALIKLGHKIGKADGKMGKLSISALKAFQADKSLKPTGKINRKTIAALRRAVRCDTKAYKTETKFSLYGAMICKDLAFLKEVLSRGIDPKELNSVGQTPITYAGGEGLKDFIKPLMNAGVSLNHVDNNGYTALMYASSNGETETVRELLALGADRYLPGDKNKTAASLAKRAKYPEILKLVKLEFDQEFQSCLMRSTKPLLQGHNVKVHWLEDTGELRMDFTNGVTLLKTQGMPRYVLMLMDSLFRKTDTPDSLLKSCEKLCASYCRAH